MYSSTASAFLEDEWFNQAPSAANAQRVAHAWRTIWRLNALQAVDAAAEGLKQPLDLLRSTIEQVDLSERLEPRLFARLAALIEAMQRGDGYAVQDHLQSWCADPPETWSSRELRTESIAVHGWERDLLKEVRGTRVQGVAPPTLFPLLETDLTPLHASALDALRRIEAVDADMHAEILANVSLIKLFRGPGVEGFSSPKAFGAIWLQMPEPEHALAWFLEHLVHECSHLHLNALLALDPLLHNPNDLQQAPIRPDPRPLFQVLHGTFVLARNCRVHQRLVERWPELGLEEALANFRQQFARGIDVIVSTMKPTARGSILLQSLVSADQA